MLSHPHFFAKLPFFNNAYLESKQAMSKVFEFFNNQIEVHKERLKDKNLSEPASDFVEAYLREIDKNVESDKLHWFTREELPDVCFDLWVAGQVRIPFFKFQSNFDEF